MAQFATSSIRERESYSHVKSEPSTARADLDVMAESYKARLATVVDLIRSQKLDSFVVYGDNAAKTNPYHLWLTGTRCTTEDGLVLLVTREGELSFIDVPWAADALRAHLKNLKIDAQIITAESSEAVRQTFLKISSPFEKIGYADVFPITFCTGSLERYRLLREVDALIIQKNSVEQAWLKESARDINRLLSSSMSAIEIGMTEAHIAARIEEEIRRIAGVPAFSPVRIISGACLPATTGRPRAEKKIERGDLICIDIGHVTSNGIYSDITRMAFVGDCSAKEEYLKLELFFEEVAQRLRAGCSVRELLVIVKDELRRVQLPERTLRSDELGHGIGYKLHEHPYLALQEDLDMTLSEGSAICLEPEIVTDNSAIRLEHEILITKAGAEIISC